MRGWIVATIILAIVVVGLIVVVVYQAHSNPPLESAAEQAEHAKERDKVMKDFYNPPKPTTRVTDPMLFDSPKTQPASK
jgi:uncharacterized membrane protein